MKKRKMLLTATVMKIHVSLFHYPCLKMFHDLGWETWVCSKNDYENPADCVVPYCDHYIDTPYERSPFKPANIKAYRMVKAIIDRENFDLVYCHTPVGAVVARLACISARKKGTKVVYMAHGFHFYKGAPLLNWLIYYPLERFFSRFTDGLITINREDYERSLKFHAGKTILIPGVGIDLKKFQGKENLREAVRQSLGIGKKQIVLLSVGELSKRKNHIAVIEALAKLKEYDILYMICGEGSMRDQLLEKAEKLGVSNQVRLLGFRKDIPALHKAADIFVFPSLQEGLPVALMEAMASGLPIVASEIRGNEDLIQDSEGGYLVNARDSVQYAAAIRKMIQNPKKREEMEQRNLKIIEDYSQAAILQKMKGFFNEIVGGLC